MNRDFWWGMLAACLLGCGGTADEGAPDATSDRRLHIGDDAADLDAVVGDAGPVTCTTPQIGIGLSDGKNPTKGCKFDVEWMCGDAAFRSGGSCDAIDGGSFQGICQREGVTTSTYKVPGTPCPCDDPDAMVKLVSEKCISQ